ncbi:hypothetical protein HGRIS_014188 [Hohenbuehelia grisea]|uniref:Cytochrome P450 n=1 Tax=Hohenbuehelia grisea TaxID=104357 RepID=A0ABR3JSW3_9AGAR
MAFRALALDAISAYCLRESMGALDTPEFQHPLIVSLQFAIPIFWILKYFPSITPFVIDPPKWLPLRFMSAVRGIFDFRQHTAEHMHSFLSNRHSPSTDGHEIIYDYLLSSNAESKTKIALTEDDLFQEAIGLLLAGSDTVGGVCTVGFYHVLKNPEILRKLQAELKQSWRSLEEQPTLAELEKLPYLTAVIKEALRFDGGVVSQMPRVVGKDGAIIGGVQVPGGTIVSMSNIYLHYNEEVFPNAHEFIPERWLSDANSKRLDSWLVPFSRGPRMCIGTNLAWCELYLVYGNLFRRLDLTLWNMDPSDYTSFDAFFVPVHHGNELHVTVQTAET